MGAALGLRVGYILGVLEGLCAAFGGERGRRKDQSERSDEVEREEGRNDEGARLKKLLAEAKKELALEKVFGREWWGEDGMWTFVVEPAGARGEKKNQNNNDKDDDEVTFIEVADQHPLLQRWFNTVRVDMQRMGVREKVFEGDEWESGRVGEFPPGPPRE